MKRSLAAASMAVATLFAPVAVAVVATAPVAIAAPATPSAGELQGKLRAAMNGSAAELASGDASGMATVNATVGRIPGYSWDVSGPVTVDGDVLSATLNSRLGDYVFPIPVTWVAVDGTWKLSQESEQTLVGYATMAW
ncbi:hypothetical protein [Nocardia camponoti]|uniref:Low molecular weight antigen MTB12-like C-terminal domain-containing protein n=1 Tax=Nocardia camponoti TaxID=1616106 RepID=A0A917QVS3_9NOCA|nr:hypothetical protein [Nocardia camponoti]GGK70063.1 hypothetical protein GCM10011591_47750 [Nocardia camponoti]